MRIKFLGTAAAEGWPAMFCTCENCKKAFELGGRNIRTRSQAIIDNKLLIDFPADTYMHMLHSGLDLPNIEHCIITHAHSDHLYPSDFGMRRVGFAHYQSDSMFTVYGTKPTGESITKNVGLSTLCSQGRVSFKCITPFVPFNIDGYTITPLKADHAQSLEPVIYFISNGEKNILYAHDTGYFPDETWQYLEQNKPKFDFVSLDCTQGIVACRHGHMSIETDFEVKNRLIELSCATSDTKFCLNHFSHNGKAVYDEIVLIAQNYGFLVSFDGMSLEI